MPTYEGINLSDEQIQLLKDRVVNARSALVTFRMAEKHYSSKNAAKNSIQSLESKGILEKVDERRYRISSLPDELAEIWL